MTAYALKASMPVYAHRGDTHASQLLSNPNPDGAPLAFLVKQIDGVWFNVYLPVRPNGATGWVRFPDVSVLDNPYRVIVSTSLHNLAVLNNGVPEILVSAATGAPDTPTPRGVFFITELLQQPDPGGPYGPYAYGLSGHSAVLADFNGGDGTVGLHGTNDPSSIGHSVTHGCIRVDNATITKLSKMLPLATMVEVI